MKKYTAILSQLLVIGIIIFNGFTADTSFAQNLFFNQRDVIEEIRPFDFSDKFYQTNGVDPSMIVNRRNGEDKLSVIDFTSDERFREVRIVGTHPAYDPNGNIIYWNHYGDLHAESFMQNTDGESAINAANYYPVYTFPSVNAKNSERQAALVTFDENYFEKNILGAAVFIEIEFTDLAQTKEAQIILEAIAEENGISLDGTPIIKRMKELNYLIRRGLVKQILRGSEDATETPFAIAKVLGNTERGAISPDSFLMYVKQPNSNEPLPAEQILVSNFECLKDKSSCGGK